MVAAAAITIATFFLRKVVTRKEFVGLQPRETRLQRINAVNVPLLVLLLLVPPRRVGRVRGDCVRLQLLRDALRRVQDLEDRALPFAKLISVHFQSRCVVVLNSALPYILLTQEEKKDALVEHVRLHQLAVVFVLHTSYIHLLHDVKVIFQSRRILHVGHNIRP